MVSQTTEHYIIDLFFCYCFILHVGMSGSKPHWTWTLLFTLQTPEQDLDAHPVPGTINIAPHKQLHVTLVVQVHDFKPSVSYAAKLINKETK